MIENLINKIKDLKLNKIIIQTHNFPDVDAVASAFGLQYLLSLYAIDSKIYYAGMIDRTSTEKLIASCNIKVNKTDGNFTNDDYIVCVDSQAGEGNVTQNGGNYLGCVDHHPLTNFTNNNESIFKEVIQVGSCSSIITLEYQLLNQVIPKDVATALLFGLKMDSLNFSRGIVDQDIDAYKILNNCADMDVVHYLETSNMVLKDLKSYGAAIENIKVISDFGISFIPFDCEDGLIAMLSEFILGLEEVSVSIVFSLRKNGIKLSVRSILPYIDAGELTKKAIEGIGSGGGHAMFAGGYIPLSSFKDMTTEEIKDAAIKLFLKTYGDLLQK